MMVQAAQLAYTRRRTQRSTQWHDATIAILRGCLAVVSLHQSAQSDAISCSLACTRHAEETDSAPVCDVHQVLCLKP